jgi:ABC-type transport system involved in Fe-S cluster assembly fused permease/ATPase subunit
MIAPVDTNELRQSAIVLVAQANADEALGIQPKDTQFYRNTAALLNRTAVFVDAQARALNAAQHFQIGTEVTEAINAALAAD